MIYTLFYFFIALLMLILIHEFGHFIVARWCGVKVLRFSFGFGRILFSWRDKKNTEYAFSLWPLGGYVKMLDETEEEVPESERHLAFNRQSVYKRIAIVLAGPLFNFILAFFALWLMWMIGMKSLAPIIVEVKPDSIAERSGMMPPQEITALNAKPVRSWREVQYALMPLFGSDKSVSLKLKALDPPHAFQTVALDLENWTLDPKKPDLLGSLGITPFIPKLPPIVGTVSPDSPAEKAGLQAGDVVMGVDEKPVNDWFALVHYIKARPDERILLLVKRGENVRKMAVQVGHTMVKGQVQGWVGVRSKTVDWPENWLRIHQASLLPAAGEALKQTAELTGLTFALIGRLVMGQVPIQSISGPIGIAQGAGESARSGLAYYLSFLALVSISLGVLNLLPIPMLDGGHLLYCLIELVKGRPVSEKIKSMGVYVGLGLLVTLMCIALTNDLTRLGS